MLRKLISVLFFCLFVVAGIAQKPKLQQDNKEHFDKIFIQDLDLNRLEVFSQYATFFNCPLLIEIKLNSDTSSYLYTVLETIELDASQLQAIKNIDKQYINGDRINVKAIKSLFSKSDWVKTFRKILAVLVVNQQNFKIDYCFKLKPQVDSSNKFLIEKLDSFQYVPYYINFQSNERSVTFPKNNPAPSNCFCNRVGKCIPTEVMGLLRGNNWVIGNTLFVGFSREAVLKYQKEYNLQDSTKAFDTFMDSILNQQYDLNGYKIVIYNAFSEGGDLPDYHLDLYFTPFEHNGKRFALFNDPQKIKTWNQPDAVLLDSFKTRLHYFEKFILKNKIVDSIIYMPSIFLRESNIGSKEFSYTNCIINNTTDSLTFYFPEFKKLTDDTVSFQQINDSCKAEITDILHRIFNGNEIVKFMDFDPYYTDNDGFLHCNFLPLYK